MHTKDKLAEALREAGLDDMAAKAAEGYYHDFLSPLDFPSTQLADDLAEAAEKATPIKAKDILLVRHRHLNGEFDATGVEADEWAETDEFKEIMGSMFGRRGV